MRVEELAGKRFPIEQGSEVVSMVWDSDTFFKKISQVIQHNLFDSYFYYNWCSYHRDYWLNFEKYTLNPMVYNIDRTLSEYFMFENTPYSALEKVLVFKNKDNQNWIDAWFQCNVHISSELRAEYYNYRKKYAGIVLK